MDPDLSLKLIATTVTLFFTAILATGGGDRRSRRLAVFLALIAANLAAEAIRLVAPPEQSLLWFRGASVVAALDPLALALFCRALLGERAIGDRVLMVTAGVAFALALWAGWGLHLVPGDAPESQLFPAALAAFTVATYGYLLIQAYGSLTREWVSSRLQWLVAALVVVSLPTVGTLYSLLYFLPGFFQQTAPGFLLFMSILAPLPALAGALLIADARRTLPAGARRAVVNATVFAVAVALATHAFSFTQVLAQWSGFAPLPGLQILGRVASPVRWIAFATLTSMALFRDDALGLRLASRRRAARLLIASVFVLVAGTILWVARAAFPGVTALGPAETAVLLFSVALSQTGHRLVDEVAFKIYGVPVRGDENEVRRAYERSVAEALGQGRAPSRDPELQQLRADLGIDIATAALIERIAEDRMSLPLFPGQLIQGRYRVGDQLGSGGGGKVFLAMDTMLDRHVVLKELHEDPLAEEAIKEARVAGALGHERIVTVYDVLNRHGSALIVSEYVPGGTLETALRGPIDAATARRLSFGVLQGVAAVHDAGIVHGDLKPANILLTQGGSPKVTDFGVARLSAGKTVGTGDGDALVGTPGFMAPEQLRGRPSTFATDVYSLGLILDRILPADAPQAARGVVDRALAPEPHARFANARELERALAAAWPG